MLRTYTLLKMFLECLQDWFTTMEDSKPDLEYTFKRSWKEVDAKAKNLKISMDILELLRIKKIIQFLISNFFTLYGNFRHV